MIKYFCDKCGNETESDCLIVPSYIHDFLGNAILFTGNKHLCEECAKKFNMIKDHLECEEDFFSMSDDETMKYMYVKIIDYLLDMLEEEHMGMRTLAIEKIKDEFGFEILL